MRRPAITDPLTRLLHRHPGAETFTFGDGPALSARLLALVIAGKKTASTGALREFDGGAAMPRVGRRDVALHWDGTPACVIETREVVTCRFDEVTAEMALAEGEDADLAGWIAGHTAYFARNGGFAPQMPVVWERFRLIEVCPATPPEVPQVDIP